MTKRNRLIVLAICTVLFFIITPYIILYSLGYRVDFKKLRIVATGGIYVKAFPQGVNVIIDSKTNDKTSILSYSVFKQNLLSGVHTVLIKKDGYYDYQKNLTIKENEVEKLEHVILIKKDIPFTLLDSNTDYFYPSPNGNYVLLATITANTAGSKKIDFNILHVTNGQTQSFLLDNLLLSDQISTAIWSEDSSNVLAKIGEHYFLLEPLLPTPKITPLPFLTSSEQATFNPQDADQIFYIKNKNLFAGRSTVPIIKNIIAYQVTQNSIRSLGYDGFLRTANLDGKTTGTVNTRALVIKNKSSYTILSYKNTIWLQEDTLLWTLNQTSGVFEDFYNPVKKVKVSPDGQKILLHNDREILFSYVNSNVPEKIFLNRLSEKVSDAFWLGDHYVVFTFGNNIIISEIDNRGNINTVQLPNIANLPDGKTVDINNPLIYFNQQDKKLYILTGNNLLSSDQLIP